MIKEKLNSLKYNFKYLKKIFYQSYIDKDYLKLKIIYKNIFFIVILISLLLLKLENLFSILYKIRLFIF